MENLKRSLSVGDSKVNNIRYVDDVVLIAGRMEQLRPIVNRVEESRRQAGLCLNPEKQEAVKTERKQIENDHTCI